MLDQGGLIHFSAGFGYEVVSNIYFGASASYGTGTYLSDREYRETDSEDRYDGTVQTNPADPRTADFQSFYLHDVRDVEYSGWDFKFGVLYKFFNFIGISASFTLPTAYTISEIRSVGGTAEYAAGRVLEVTPSEAEQRYRVRPPSEITVGTMVNLWILTGALEATYIDYTQIEPTSGLSLATRSLGIKEVKSELTQVININGGAEFRLPFTGLSARAGFMYRPSPFKNDPMEYDTKVVTAGFGINSADRLNLDLAYAVAFWKQRGNQYGLGEVTQDVVTHDVLISVRFSF
jgi:long-subunit fatty acid transport protein